MKIPDKQQLIILALASTIILGFGVFRYYPIARQTRAVQRAEADQQTESVLAEAQSHRLPTLYHQVKKLREDLRTYDEQIPESRCFAALYQQIAEVMSRHNLKEQLVQPDGEIEGVQLNCIPVTIKCSGTLNQIFELFKSLGGLERLIRIEHVQLENDKDFSGWIKADAKVNVYYRPSTAGSI